MLWDGFRVDDSVTGAPLGVATVTGDVSERRRAEQEATLRARQQAADG